MDGSCVLEPDCLHKVTNGCDFSFVVVSSWHVTVYEEALGCEELRMEQDPAVVDVRRILANDTTWAAGGDASSAVQCGVKAPWDGSSTTDLLMMHGGQQWLNGGSGFRHYDDSFAERNSSCGLGTSFGNSVANVPSDDGMDAERTAVAPTAVDWVSASLLIKGSPQLAALIPPML